MKEPEKPDTYRNFEHLSRHEREGVDFTIEFRDRGSSLLVMAPHGGRIEPLTFRLARLIAGKDFSFYGFRAIKEAGNWKLHLTSHRFDEPAGLDLIQRARTVLTIHGLKGEETAVSIGGLTETLIQRIGNRLSEAGFTILRPGRTVAGLHPENICNRGESGAGVQLELSIGLRAELKEDECRLLRFVDATRAALCNDLDSGFQLSNRVTSPD